MGTNIKNLFRQLAQALPGQDEATRMAGVKDVMKRSQKSSKDVFFYK